MLQNSSTSITGVSGDPFCQSIVLLLLPRTNPGKSCFVIPGLFLFPGRSHLCGHAAGVALISFNTASGAGGLLHFFSYTGICSQDKLIICSGKHLDVCREVCSRLCPFIGAEPFNRLHHTSFSTSRGMPFQEFLQKWPCP